MPTVDSELTRMGQEVRAVAAAVPHRAFSRQTKPRHRTHMAVRVLGFAAMALLVIGGPALLFRSSSLEQFGEPTVNPPPSTVTVPTETTLLPETTEPPHIWYLLDAPGWRMITANRTAADRGSVNTRYSTDPTSAFGNQASLTTDTNPAELTIDLVEPFGDTAPIADESLVVGDKTVRLITFADNLYYATWTDLAGVGLALSSSPGIGDEYGGVSRDEFISLIDFVVEVPQESWETSADEIRADPPPNPSDSDWVEATGELALAFLQSEEGSVAVWSRRGVAGDSDLVFYGDPMSTGGFVTVPLSDTESLIAAIDQEAGFSGAVWVFLSNGDRVSVEIEAAAGLATAVVQHPATTSVLQAVAAGAPTG